MYLEIEFWAITIKDTEYPLQISKSTLLKETATLTHTKVGSETAQKQGNINR